MLRNPQFDPEDNGAMNRLLAFGGGLKGKSERDQLKSTIRACQDSDQLATFIEADPERARLLADKKVIHDVATINLNNKGMDIRDQVADRIYDIRCRVVHAKDDGGRGGELLVPYSSEAAQLSTDLDLVQFVAQNTLFASARPIRF